MGLPGSGGEVGTRVRSPAQWTGTVKHWSDKVMEPTFEPSSYRVIRHPEALCYRNKFSHTIREVTDRSQIPEIRNGEARHL